MRQIQGKDGRDLLQMLVEMGILQMETNGRPDGVMQEGFEAYYDYLGDRQDRFYLPQG